MKKLVYFTLALLTFPFLVEAQTLTENYTKNTSFQVATQDGNVSEDDKIETVVYYDGLGRRIQEVSQRVGGNREDLITPINYDALGRTTKDYLPLPVSNNANGDYYTGGSGPTVEHEIKEFYRDKFPNDFYQGDNLIPDYDNPYSQRLLESSPLNRVLKQGAPGFDWHAVYSEHTIEFQYEANIASEVYKFSVNLTGADYTPSLVYDGYYSEGQLLKNVIKDENWVQSDGVFGKTYQFTNKQGQVVLKRRSVDPEVAGATQDPNYHDTYYIYDDLGNLSYVLSPEGSNKIIVNNVLAPNHVNILNDLCYQYKHDGRNRLTHKRLPGKSDWEYMFYDKLDRVILSQDPNLKADGDKWLFTKYDKFGRIAYTGILSNYTKLQLESILNTSSLPLFETQKNVPETINGTDVYYTNSAFPQSDIEIFTVNYFGEYIDTGGLSNLPPTNVYGEAIISDVRGLATVSKIRVLDGLDNPVPSQFWITSQTGYDEFARPIYVNTENTYLNTTSTVETFLNFVGNPVESKAIHGAIGINTGQIITKNYFTYDHVGRLITQEQEIDDEPVQLIVKNHYDELGQLERKDVGGETFVDGYTDLQGVDVSFDGIVEKTNTNSGWNSSLKTRGEIVAQEDGGIQAEVKSTGKGIKVGLYKTTQGLVPYDYLQYGILYTGQTSGSGYELKYIISGTEYSTSQIYQTGDLLSVERVGSIIEFSLNGNVFHSTPAIENALVGKAVFDQTGGRIEEFVLYGNNIDEVLQEVDFRYNVRGWMTDINDIEKPIGLVADSDLFKFRINYNKVEGNDDGEEVYNGNIAQTLWKTTHDDSDVRGYNYSYDDLGRIKGAVSYKGPTIAAMVLTGNHDVSNLNYDRNGNILSLKRQGFDDDNLINDTWDDLSYSYNGNLLENVTDNLNGGALENYGFIDGNTGNTDDFDYDFNGNIVADRNKGLNNITYNHLNLPTKLTIDNGIEVGSINYIYDALGTKIKKETISNGSSTVTKYDGGYVLVDDVLQFILHPEGYIEPVAGSSESVKGFRGGQVTQSSFKYVFQYKDHLGNVRLSYSDLDKNGSINPATEIIEESNYYPFGLKHKGYNNEILSSGNSVAQKWKHNGIEFEEALGSNLSEMFYRMHDPSIGRWNRIDPITHWSESTFTAFGNNPIFWADPSGADPGNDQSQPIIRVGNSIIIDWDQVEENGGATWWNNNYQQTGYSYSFGYEEAMRTFSGPGAVGGISYLPHITVKGSSKSSVPNMRFVEAGFRLQQSIYSQVWYQRYYGQANDGSFSDDVIYSIEMTNQINPIAAIWDLLAYTVTGEDRYGNPVGQGEAYLIPLSFVPAGKIGVVAKTVKTSKTSAPLWKVGAYNELKKVNPGTGLDAHHVGQAKLMEQLVPGYNRRTAPSILVPAEGHTFKGPRGIVSRSTKGLKTPRDVVARDIRELRRVYPELPNSALETLINLNKTQYPSAFIKN